MIYFLYFNFILGIIIDTFAVLREEEEKKANDRENFCFICGYDRFFNLKIFISKCTYFN